MMDDLIDKALKIAVKAHEGQVDRGDNPYILHPIWVALHCNSEDEKIVALLHDVVEDSDIILDDLSREGFPTRIIEALDCITKKKDEEYYAYINRVAENQIARRVKVHDLFHNSDLSRIPNLIEKDIERKQVYMGYASFLMFVDEEIYRDEAEEEIKSRKILAKWKQLSIESGEKDNSWNGCNRHYYASYECETKNVIRDYTKYFKCGDFYFPTIESLENAIKEIGEENVKKYILGVKK